jgi:parallel beta-helix repeat protein
MTIFFVLVAAMFVMTVPMNVGADWTGDVTIKSDGSVDPSGAPISVSGSTYTLTDNILGTIIIEKSGITLDGDGYDLKGDKTKTGIYANSLSDLTIKDLDVVNQNVGIRFDSTSDSTITGNNIYDINRAGIALWYSGSNGNIISENDITECGWGVVMIYGAHSNTISDNTIYGYNSGIQIAYDAYGNTVKDNIIKDAFHGAVYMTSSSSNTITGNDMIDNGIIIWGGSLSYWDTHTIDTTNTVNDDPVYYWVDVNGGKVPKDAGQVILANCKNVKVTGQDIDNANQGIVLGYSSNCKITEN